jgi:hypothetical protein
MERLQSILLNVLLYWGWLDALEDRRGLVLRQRPFLRGLVAANQDLGTLSNIEITHIKILRVCADEVVCSMGFNVKTELSPAYFTITSI